MVARGVGLEDLPEIYRSEYLHAIELTRVSNDPSTDWDGFVEALWRALVPAFGLDVDVEEPRGSC
jgi:hypothetical protein